MKSLFVTIALALVSSNAQASFFMIECSNASGSVKTQGGHSPNTITIETRKDGQVGSVELSLADVEINVQKEIKVSSKSEQHCDKNSKSGYASWQNVEVQEVTISGRDGKKLPAEASAGDGKGVIKTTLLCENNGNSMIMCE